MPEISETDLIINADGSVYHLHLKPEHIADQVIVVGDPERVPLVSKYFDSIEFTNHKREFVTHSGYVGKTRLTVISSGIGTDNVEILMNELDALANIDLTTRKLNSTHKSLNIIRIGTSGSIQSDIPVDSFVYSENAIGIDGLNDFYKFEQNQKEKQICNEVRSLLEMNTLPYFANGSENLIQKLGLKNDPFFIGGTTLTCPGFYAPQGRTLNYTSKINDYLNKISKYNYQGIRLTNLEMETAGYYMFSQILGHNCISLSAILANRIVNRFSQIPEKQIDTLIKRTIESLS
jgi:uridine phosphorylase